MLLAEPRVSFCHEADNGIGQSGSALPLALDIHLLRNGVGVVYFELGRIPMPGELAIIKH